MVNDKHYTNIGLGALVIIAILGAIVTQGNLTIAHLISFLVLAVLCFALPYIGLIVVLPILILVWFKNSAKIFQYIKNIQGVK